MASFVEAVDDERILRRARKVIWAFRLIFYSGAAIAAFLLLSGPSEPGPSVLTGTTDQGRGIVITLNGDVPDRLTTTLVGRCDNGGAEYTRSLQTAPLTTDGDTFEVNETSPQRWPNGNTGTATLTIRGRLDGDTAHGTV